MKNRFESIFKIHLPTALILSFLLVSCYHVNRDIVQKPEKIIPHNTMVSIITDINLVDGIVSYDNINRVNNKNLKKEYYNRVFIKYGITSDEFEQNMEYYSSQYDEMLEIYDEVIGKLTAIKENIKKKEQQLKRQNTKTSIPPSPMWNSDSIATRVDSLMHDPGMPVWVLR
jgi:hypothetical protein